MGLEDDRVALIDLDGTVADYDTALAREMQRLRSPEEQELHKANWGGAEPPHLEARRQLIQRRPGFWRNLERIELGFEVVEDLRALGFALHVLTKGPSSNSTAWSEKLEWCRQHLPDACVTVTEDKSLVYGRVLVDDYPAYFKKWLQFRPRGLVVAIAHPWNEDIFQEPHPNLLRYDGTNREDLRRHLRQAFERKSGETL